MKINAIKFSGVGSLLANEAVAIFEFVKESVDSNRDEFDRMEQAVRDQLTGGRTRMSRGPTPKGDFSESESVSRNSVPGHTANVILDGVATTVNLGKLPTSLVFDGGHDSDE